MCTNQRKYFDLARTNDVVITSRMHGSYRLVPISDEDTLINGFVLEDKIKRGIEEYNNGKDRMNFVIIREQEPDRSNALPHMIEEEVNKEIAAARRYE